MTVLFFISLLFPLESPISWETYLDIYRPIPEKMSIVGPDNLFYILDYRECTIHMVDKKGTFKGVFAGKGDAPGLVSYPTVYEIYFFGDKLYLSTKGKTLIYSPGGQYISQQRANKGSRMRKVENGWIVYDIKEDRRPRPPASIKWVNDSFKGETILFTWEREDNKTTNAIIKDVGIVAFTDNSSRMFVRKPNSGSITIFDTKTLKITGVIHKGLPRVRIGNDEVALIRKTGNRKEQKIVPEYYPEVYKLSWIN